MDNDPKSDRFAAYPPSQAIASDAQSATDGAPVETVAPDGGGVGATQLGAPQRVATPEAAAAQIGRQTSSLEKKARHPEGTRLRRVLGAVSATRRVLVIPAIASALYGGWVIEQERTNPLRTDLVPPVLGWQFLAAGGLLLALAAFPGITLIPSGASTFLKTLVGFTRRQRFLFLVPLFLAIACGLASVPLFWQLNAASVSTEPEVREAIANNWLANNSSWLLWIAALLLFGFAFVVWERSATLPPEDGTQADPPEDRLPVLIERLLMAGLFIFALATRFYDLDSLPPGLWFDEAQNGLVAQRLVTPGEMHVTYIGDRYVQSGMLDLYVIGTFIKMFGNTVWAERFLAALAGSICVPLLYLLATRLYGWRVGLSAAALTSVSAWHITFSRFGITSMVTVAYDIAGYLCIAQALRTGRLGYYAGAGIFLGLGLHGYYSAKFAFAILGLVLLHRLVAQRMRLVRSVRAGFVVFAVAVLLAFLPVGLFALQNPGIYSSRVNTVSIFSPKGSEGMPDALRVSIEKHALMFNWAGDRNGRHNLPGLPNLDWVTASLFIAGLAACAVRAWRWQYFFPVVWFLITPLGGVLSLVWEAPQAGRTVENSVVTALIAGIFLGEVWQVLTRPSVTGRLARLYSRMHQPGRRHVSIGLNRIGWAGYSLVVVAGVFLVIWWAGSMTLHRYFEVQAKDISVWKEMGAREKAAGIGASRYGADHDIYLAPILKGPAIEYLAPNVQTIEWPGLHVLPFTSTKSSGVVLTLDIASAGDVNYIARMYPNATFEIHKSPIHSEPLLYIINIPASDIKAVQGVRSAVYEPGSTKPRSEKEIVGFSYDWSTLGVKSGTLRLSTILKVEQFGAYTFDWKNDGHESSPAELLVDGYPVSAGQLITLVSGLHTIVATNTVESGAGVSRLLWGRNGGQLQSVPAEQLFDPQQMQPRGLSGLLRAGTTFDAPPTGGRIDPVLSFYFHKTPLNRPYTVQWKGKLYIPEDGMYTLSTEQISRSQLLIDGERKLDNGNPNKLMDAQFDLTAGFHDIELLFFDLDNSSHMYLYWTPPGKQRTIVPSAFLFPVMGKYPNSDSANLPTLAEADGSRLPEDRIIWSIPPATNEESQVSDQPQPRPSEPQGVNVQPETPLQGKNIEPILTIGDKGERLFRPKAVAADEQGNIYIYTEGGSKVNKFDAQGNPVASWELTHINGLPITEGSALIAQRDHLLVLDARSSMMARYTLDGEVDEWTLMCDCLFPRGMAPSKDGNFWIANTAGHHLVRVDPSGKALRTVGDMGDQPGQFLEPSSVWEAPDGTIFVADIGNHRVQSLDQDFKPLAQWEMGYSVARDGNRLTGDSQGNVLVTQFEARAVVRYDKSGKELDRWVYSRSGEAAVPSGIAPFGNDKFVVLYPEVGIAIVFALDE